MNVYVCVCVSILIRERRVAISSRCFCGCVYALRDGNSVALFGFIEIPKHHRLARTHTLIDIRWLTYSCFAPLRVSNMQSVWPSLYVYIHTCDAVIVCVCVKFNLCEHSNILIQDHKHTNTHMVAAYSE